VRSGLTPAFGRERADPTGGIMTLADVAAPTQAGGPESSGPDAMLRLLLAPLDGDPSRWCQELTRCLEHLVEADAGACLLWQDGRLDTFTDGLEPEILTEYLAEYASLDQGMQRRDALGLTLWSRDQLWRREVLHQSRYYNEFARPHRLCDSIGLSIEVDQLAAHLRVVLLYRAGPLGMEGAEQRRARLQPLLPTLRTGLGIQLGFRRGLGHTASLLEKIGERLVLFSLEGRELYRNASMRRTLAQDACRERLYEGLQSAARAIANLVQPHHPGAARRALPHVRDARREVDGETGRYRLRACLLGPEAIGADSLVLVTMNPLASAPASAAALRERFALTARESQVAALLLQRLTNREIAMALGISTHTARHHTENVLVKTQVSSRRALPGLLAPAP
jgi:DNA-binding CsgD family transcriptional regulator